MAKKNPSDELDPFEVVRAYADRHADRDGRLYGGIDPGFSGAIAVVDETGYDVLVVDIPTVRVEAPGAKKTKKGNVATRGAYDDQAIVGMFELLEPVYRRLSFLLEAGTPRPTDTPLTGYAVGWGTGMWPLFFKQIGVPLFRATPNAWKQRAGLSGRDKEFARLKAQSEYPSAPLARKEDHNRAEALLLAGLHRRQEQANG